LSSKVRIHQIQALRAIAATLVVLFHAKLAPGGFIGVDIFYVISGYLITGIIVKEIVLTNAFNYRAFFLRRAKRLLPASLSILLLTALAAWLFLPQTVRASLGKDIFAATVYVSNYLFAWWQNDYQNLDATPSPVIHYWSLAVEEQFYLVWPLIIFSLWKIGQQRLVFRGVAAITSLSFLFSLYLTNAAPIWAFYSLPTRAWELGVGALILFIPKKIVEEKSVLRSLLVWLSAFALLYGVIRFSDSTPFPGTAALYPVVATALLIVFIRSWPPILNDFSKLKFVQWLGEISYPFYLWHWPLLVIPSTRFGRPLSLWERFLLIALTALAADLTHRFIEKPFSKKVLTDRQTARFAIVATLSGVLVAGAILVSVKDEITLPNGGSISLAQVMKKPKIYDDGCHVNYGEKVSPECLYGDTGSERKIVLYGDSHAAQWFPALEKIATDQGFALISLTKSACPAAEVDRVESGAFKNSDCNAWRKNSIERIRKLNPEAVIMSGFQHFAYPGSFSSRDAWWFEGQRALYRNVLDSSPKLIYISDTPKPLRDIPSCLTTAKSDECDQNAKSDPRVSGGFITLDPTSWLCDRNCPAIVDGIVAYRDASHISAAMSLSLSEKLREFLASKGVA
jgi:peptidoglycan/LPS O-acetylase OafA/YrhL